MIFKDLLLGKDGIIKGPFGGDIKKSLFVPKSENTYKVLEQGVVINEDLEVGEYYLESEYVYKKLRRFIVEEGDILITGAGTLGKLFEVKNMGIPSVINQALIRIRLNEEVINKQFFKYYFNFYFIRTISGINGDSVIPNLPPLSIIRETTVQIPSLKKQKRIAAVLSALDDKRALNSKINSELEALTRTLYDYWFVQFDFPDAEGKPYKASGGKMIYNDELKREVPAGWEVVELRNYLSSNRGLSYNGKDILGNGIPMINLNSFNINSTYKPEGIKSFSGSYSVTKTLNPFDLVMCNTQQTALDPKKDIIGKCFLVPDIFDTEVVSSHHITTICVKVEYLKYYLHSLFNTEYFHRYISGYATGTNILGLDFEGVLSYRIAVPNEELLLKYKAIIVNIHKQQSITIKENQKLIELRDWLLPMLMNGQVTVTKAFEAVERKLDMVAEENMNYSTKI